MKTNYAKSKAAGILKASTLVLALMILGGTSRTSAQNSVVVGAGSYASALPSAENVTTDANPIYVLPGVSAPVPTNDWWTPLILKNMYGTVRYHLWAHPLDFTVENYGLAVYYPTAWSGGANMNQQMVSPNPVKVGGAGFAPTSERVKSWGDWTVAFRLEESASRYVDVTIGHGLPYTWLEYSGINSGQVTTDATASYYNVSGGAQAFPFTGTHYGFLWQGRNYAVFAPAGTSFSLANGVVTAAFAGADRYLVLAAMPARTDLPTFLQYAFAVPRNSTVSWNYNEELGELATTWNVTSQALQGSNTDVLQGFLPHQLKYTTLNFVPTGISYLSARGQVRCAAGNNFQIKYKHSGILSNLPEPEVLPTKPNGYSAAQLNGYIGAFSANAPLLGASNTYGAGKSLTQFARFLANATVLGNGNAGILKTKLRTALADWLTYTPGESHTYFAYLNNFKALMGFDVGFGSEEFNDHHFHYGYHVYAAGVLGLHDPAFVTQYGAMAKLVAKEYANWDRSDLRFPLFRTFDPWEGHSWANGGYGMNPPIGNNQESTSEAMMAWTGLVQLGLATGDQGMTDAGVFGYVTEAAAANEYWFNRDNDNFPNSYGPAGKIASIVGGSNIEYQTFFGGDPIFVHAIQYVPVVPSSYYLVQNDKFVQAQTEFDYLRARSVAGGFGDVGSWGTEWNNLALQYASLFNPDWSAANQNALGTDPGQAGLSYYTIHANRLLGHRSFDYRIGATNSGVFYNPDINQFTYCAFNPTSTSQTYNVYHNATIIGVITVPANSFYSTHVLGSRSNVPPTATITAPASGIVVAAPAAITITATAADTDGTVAQVAFYDGMTRLAIVSSPPYAYTWTGAAAGLHTITAQAIDNGGAVGTSSAVSVTVTGAPCTGTVANGDYRYEVSTSGGTVNWTFIPQAPIAGSTLALIYIRTGTGPYTGAAMTAQGSNFVFSQARALGTALTFYFTYRVGATMVERNSAATPHTYTVGDVCGATLAVYPTANALNSWKMHPNPVQRYLTVDLLTGAAGELVVTNIIGTQLLRRVSAGGSTSTRLDLSALPAGMYMLQVRTAAGMVTRRFIKE